MCVAILIVFHVMLRATWPPWAKSSRWRGSSVSASWRARCCRRTAVCLGSRCGLEIAAYVSRDI